MIIYPCTQAISKLLNCKNFKKPSLKTNKFLGDFRAKQEICVAASLLEDKTFHLINRYKKK